MDVCSCHVLLTSALQAIFSKNLSGVGQPPSNSQIAGSSPLPSLTPLPFLNMYMRSMVIHLDIALNTTLPGKPFEDLPGPILLDGLLQSFLLGTIVNQAFKYLMDYRDDSWKKRVFVMGVIGLSM